jgi:hypothetical protein
MNLSFTTAKLQWWNNCYLFITDRRSLQHPEDFFNWHPACHCRYSLKGSISLSLQLQCYFIFKFTFVYPDKLHSHFGHRKITGHKKTTICWWHNEILLHSMYDLYKCLGEKVWVFGHRREPHLDEDVTWLWTNNEIHCNVCKHTWLFLHQNL